MINKDYKPQYPPAPVQEIRSLIEAAEKRIHTIQNSVGGNTEAEQDVYILCKEMLTYTHELMASYIGPLEGALARAEREEG